MSENSPPPRGIIPLAQPFGSSEGGPTPFATDLTVVVPCYNERPNVAPLIAKLHEALAGIAWEVVFVDDNSPDGTSEEVRAIAQADSRVCCIRRIGRRGLSSAVIEGALSSSAAHIAVMDGDLQHDETRLPLMLAALKSGAFDLVVGSRHVAGGDNAGLAGSFRVWLSNSGIRAAQFVLPSRVSDPMSGFFMLPRVTFERVAPHLSGQGFKILVDLLLSAPAPLRVHEIPFEFRERHAGESKLDILVMVQFVGLLADKMIGGVVPSRFISFASVGAVGVVVHLAVLTVCRLLGLGFSSSQTAATILAMIVNFSLNNSITYRDQRLRGPALWRGLLIFMVVCGLGAIANIGIARVIYMENGQWTPAGLLGAVLAVVWNFAVSSTLVWRRR